MNEILRQNSALASYFVKYFVRFWGNEVSRKNAFEISQPLVSQQQKLAFTLSKLGTRQLVFWYDPTIAFTHAALDPSITKGIVCVMRTMN